MNKLLGIIIPTCFLFSCQNLQNNADSVSDKVNKIYTGPIIDMHIHAVMDGGSQLGATATSISGKEYLAPNSAEEHQEQTLEKFKQYNIVKAVVSPQLGVKGNSPAELWHKIAPETVIIGNSYQTSIDLLRKKHSEGKLGILAEVAPIYEGILPTDEQLTKYFDLVEELDIPIGYHLLPGGPPGAAYSFAPKLRAIQAKPLQFEEILLSHPKMRIYIMHAGWPYLDDMKALMYAHPQVYVELGVIDWLIPRQEFHNFLKGLVDAGFGKRIMFGTDQMAWVDTIDDAIDAVNSAEFLSADQKADIFYNNASRFLRLSEEEIKKHHEIATHNKR